VAQMFRGERAEASQAFTKVIGAGRSSGNLMFAAVAATALAGIYVTNYQLQLGAKTYRDAIDMIADPGHVLGFEAHLGLGKILYDWNELDEAESLALLCSDLVARAKSQTELGADVLRARLMLARNEDTAAEALLARVDGLVNAGSLTDRLREAAELRILQMLRRGQVKGAADLASTHQLALGLPRTLWAHGNGPDALRAIDTHRRSMQAQGRVYDALKASVVQAMVLHGVGEITEALQVLRQAVVQAQPQNSVRLFVDEGAPMQALLTHLKDEAGISAYVSRLLAAFSPSLPHDKQATVATPAPTSHVARDSFSQRELEILRLVQQGHSNQQIGEKLFLSLSTVKWHNQNIFSKLDVQRRTEAVARALQLKLL
jgi:LuxR family maltose regulon positive regulatory protein